MEEVDGVLSVFESMNKITLRGKVYGYRVITYCIGEESIAYCTEFYDGTLEKTNYGRISRLFNPMLPHEKFKVTFSVPFSITDTSLTKTALTDKLKNQLDLLTRADEIKRGELIDERLSEPIRKSPIE